MPRPAVPFPAAPAVRVHVAWGGTVLHEAYACPPRSLRAGVALPWPAAGELLDARDAARPAAIVPPGVEAARHDADGSRHSLPPAELPRRVPLRLGSQVVLRQGALRVVISGEPPEPRLPRRSANPGRPLAALLGALVVVAAVVGAARRASPVDRADRDAPTAAEQRWMQHILARAEPPGAPAPAAGSHAEVEPAAAPEGSPALRDLRARYAEGGWSPEAPPAELGRRAASYGIIDLLRVTEEDRAIARHWRRAEPAPFTPGSAADGLYGPSTSGRPLGLSGTGMGSGSPGSGIPSQGVDSRPTGRALAHQPLEDAAPAPIARHGVLRLAPGAAVRVVRGHAMRFQHCYEAAMRSDPLLEGRVTMHITIGTDGRVASATAETDLTDATIGACMSRVAGSLRFPPPGDEPLTIHYPIVIYPSFPG